MYLPAVPGGELLDVGCGSGDALKFMQQLGGKTTGVDFDPQAARAAKLQALDVRIRSLESQQFPDERFDAVTLSHVIEHLQDPLRALHECRRILKPGGRLSVVTLNIESLGHRRYGRNWKCLEPPRHLRLFGPAALRTLVERAGFVDVSVRTSIRDAYGIYIGSRAIGRDGVYVMGAPQPAAVRLWARAMELGVWFRLKYRPDAGEEIVLLAAR